MELDWRLILFQAINFLVLMALLARFLFKPLRRVVDERRAEMAARDHKADEREAAAEAVRLELERRLAGIEEEAKRLREKGRHAGEQDAQRLVAEAREEVERLRRQAAEDVAQARRTALAELCDEVHELAIEAASQVVRGMHDRSLVETYAREGARRLRQSRDLGPDDVVSVRCDPAADPDALRALLQAELGTPAIEVTPDAEVTGGVVLATSDIEVEASAQASLRTWAEELHRHEEPTP